MKKGILAAICMMIFASLFSFAFAEDFIIHSGVTFGMEKELVKDAEAQAGFTQLSESNRIDMFDKCTHHRNNDLQISGTVAGRDGSIIIYHFNNDDKLESAIYCLGWSKRKNGTVSILNDLIGLLKEKYGATDSVAQAVVEGKYVDSCIHAFYEEWNKGSLSKVEVTGSNAFSKTTETGDTVVIYAVSLNIALIDGSSAGEYLFVDYQLYEADTYSAACEKIGAAANSVYDDL